MSDGTEREPEPRAGGPGALPAARRARVPGADRRRGAQHAAHRRRRPARRRRIRGGMPLPEFAVPELRRGARRRRQHRPGRLRDVREPLPAGRPPDARLPDRGGERDPRLRPLRPPAGDQLLVLQSRRLPADPGSRATRSHAAIAGGSTSSRSRPRGARGARRDRRRARVGPAGRVGPGRRGLEPLSGRRLSRRSPTPTPAGCSPRRESGRARSPGRGSCARSTACWCASRLRALAAR